MSHQVWQGGGTSLALHHRLGVPIQQNHVWVETHPQNLT